MARLTISAGANSYDFPDGFDITGENMSTRTDQLPIVGRMGAHMRSYGNTVGSKQIRVEGRIFGTDAADLNTKLNAMMSVITGGVLMQLTDNTLSRHTFVRLDGVRTSDRDHSFIKRIVLVFVAPRGAWTVDPIFTPNVTSVSITSTKLVRYAHINYAGSVHGPAQMLLTPDASTWPASGAGLVVNRGSNLLRNSSYEEGVGTGPDDWTLVNTPYVVEHFGRTAQRCVQLRNVGGTQHYYNQDVPCDASTEYTLSGYFALVDPAGGAANALMVVASFNAASGFLASTVGPAVSVTAGTWQRASVVHTSHASAAFLRVDMRCSTSGKDLYHDDGQLEKGGVATDFIDTSEPRYQHTSFELDSGTFITQASAESLAIDHVRGRTRRVSGGTWSEFNDQVNGHYFDLVPGLNHIEFSPPLAGNLDVEIRYRDLTL
tara:strand:- start:20927 stop:22222 length:1296 start_codon:yes stop_codon:yes gene_type:complete